MSITSITTNGQITVPVSIRRQLKLEPGDTVSITVVDNEIRVVAVVVTPRDKFEESLNRVMAEQSGAIERLADL